MVRVFSFDSSMGSVRHSYAHKRRHSYLHIIMEVFSNEYKKLPWQLLVIKLLATGMSKHKQCSEFSVSNYTKHRR